jgi:hypothetical protein
VCVWVCVGVCGCVCVGVCGCVCVGVERMCISELRSAKGVKHFVECSQN